MFAQSLRTALTDVTKHVKKNPVESLILFFRLTLYLADGSLYQ